MTFLDTLEASAKAATKGPWFHRQATVTPPYPYAEKEYDWLSDTPEKTPHTKVIMQRGCLYGGRSDYAYIALANPDNILALVRVAREAEAFRQKTVACDSDPKNAQKRTEQDEAIVDLEAALDSLPK